MLTCLFGEGMGPVGSRSTCGCLRYRNQMPTVPGKGDPHHQEAFVSKWGFFPNAFPCRVEGAGVPGGRIRMLLKRTGKCSQSPSTCSLLVREVLQPRGCGNVSVRCVLSHFGGFPAFPC